MRTHLRRAVFALGLLWPGLFLAAHPPLHPLRAAADSTAARPRLVAMVIELSNGRSYALNPSELADEKGGVLFWNDWAVYNILVPFYVMHPELPTRPADVLRLWNTLGPDGELPAFLIKPQCVPINPMNPQGLSGEPFAPGVRPKVVALSVTLEDGRSYSLTQLELHDGKSGVLFWGDFAIRNMLVPFYALNRSLPTKPADVLRLWGEPARLKTESRTFTGLEAELPGFLLKPQCVPEYPLGE